MSLLDWCIQTSQSPFQNPETPINQPVGHMYSTRMLLEKIGKNGSRLFEVPRYHGKSPVNHHDDYYDHDISPFLHKSPL